MITGIALQDKDESHNDGWKEALSSAVRDPLHLLELLDLTDQKYQDQVLLGDKFNLFVPLSYVKKMKKGDWNDPLLKQVLPIKDETVKVFGFVSDPVGDLNAEISTGVLKKYQGRVLIVTTGACAVHCRYCFRRHFPYANSMPDKAKWQQTLEVIKSDESISEVILSGGDPLMLPDDRLSRMCQELANIPHVKTLRFHTRVPVFLPERITSNFLSWLAKLGTKVVMVVHANHANELDEEFERLMKKISAIGVTLLNQSVLLKNINDDVIELSSLSERLFECDILPYYVHQLDKVQGAAHFEVTDEEMKVIQNQMRECLPGYLVPKFVREVSGERSKHSLE